MTNGNLALLARTAAHLQPSQITQRARLRAQRTALRCFPPARYWLMAGPDPARGGRLARPVQPARRAALAELARVPAAASGTHRPARPDQDAGHGRRHLADEGDAGRPVGRGLGRGPLDAGRLGAGGLEAGGRARPVAVPPALLGLGLAAGFRAGPGRRPGLVRGDVAVLAGGRSGRAAETPGCPTRPPCGPGPSAACTVTWSRAAPSRTRSSPACPPTPGSCAGTWRPTSAAIT